MLPIFLAGGAYVAAVTQTSTVTEVDMYNHTLRGERILAKEVVCRSRWGTPMLPDGKGGYSLVAPINQEFITLSLFQPPRDDGMPYRPATLVSIPVVPAP